MFAYHVELNAMFTVSRTVNKRNEEGRYVDVTVETPRESNSISRTLLAKDMTDAAKKAGKLLGTPVVCKDGWNGAIAEYIGKFVECTSIHKDREVIG